MIWITATIIAMPWIYFGLTALRHDRLGFFIGTMFITPLVYAPVISMSYLRAPSPLGYTPSTFPVDKVLEDQIEQLVKGSVILNAPAKMRLGEKVRIQVEIVKELPDQIKRDGEIRNSGSEKDEILVGNVMSVMLDTDLDNVRIDPVGWSDHFLIHGVGTWPFLFTPLSYGTKHRVTANVAVKLKLDRGPDETSVVGTVDKDLEVIDDPWYRFGSLWAEHWEWFGTAMLIPLAGSVWTRLRPKKKTVHKRNKKKAPLRQED